jgi:hypothetical protein
LVRNGGKRLKIGGNWYKMGFFVEKWYKFGKNWLKNVEN